MQARPEGTGGKLPARLHLENFDSFNLSDVTTVRRGETKLDANGGPGATRAGGQGRHATYFVLLSLHYGRRIRPCSVNFLVFYSVVPRSPGTGGSRIFMLPEAKFNARAGWRTRQGRCSPHPRKDRPRKGKTHARSRWRAKDRRNVKILRTHFHSEKILRNIISACSIRLDLAVLVRSLGFVKPEFELAATK